MIDYFDQEMDEVKARIETMDITYPSWAGPGHISLEVVVYDPNLNLNNGLFQAMKTGTLTLRFPAVRTEGPVYEGEIVHGDSTRASVATLPADGRTAARLAARLCLPEPGR